ncbi:uncharacterized protein LOC103313314 [Tribolium castaneum]|uniref:Uncharacterized protein n=1 Tax=Tribolium castaneum TaxID=7070 RepID=A0A139WPK2_TRICA|nr:PREDICTED: uncharacterized protein LOC103313314 [Tribolium castaneum]KYB29918.1 hypothetical protein TcasGA2_TC031822 [Tribolium castaneum]|eukprot:XP_008194551.1 PREDICTED: uncharacterized protein LOC103313314 [Tribolium castaneum]
MMVTKVLVLVTVLQIQTCVTIKNNFDKTSEILFNLTNYAIESRQIRNPCLYERDQSKYYTCLKKLKLRQYGHISFNYHPQKPYSSFAQYQYPSRPHQEQQSVMDVLYTIAKNDALRCVQRLLCEVTSDTISKSRQGFALPTFPFNIDMGSIIRLLATIDIPSGSPIPVFAKAALLGYVSKGNSDSCLDAYPQCPRDPNKLVHYLNNYNGGFFRFFKGVDTRPSQVINYPQNFPLRPYQNSIAQERIQNRPTQQDVSNNYVGGSDPVLFSDSDASFNVYSRLPKTLSFPTDDDNRFNEFTFKKPKELPFSISEYYSNELDLQRPLPNHRVTPMIFPDRTGTGDLRLDLEELNENYKQSYNLQNNFVSFRPVESNIGSYYRGPEGDSTDEFNTNKAVFSFPV